MSYKACYGHGLVLTDEEFSKFLNNYQRRCEDDDLKDIIESVFDEDISISEVMLTGADKSHFYVTETADGIQGFELIPYMRGGKTNRHECLSGYVLTGTPHVYIIEPDLEIDGPNYFETENKSYKTYSDLLYEFQAKLKPYLSMNFNWDAHIGRYSYVYKSED